jgi:signal transduction histidine kinase
MIRKITFLFSLFFIFITIQIHAQTDIYSTIDSLKVELKHTKNNSRKTVLLINLSSYLGYIDSDEAVNYAKQALLYAQKAKDQNNIADAYSNLGIAYEIKSDYAHALINLYEAHAIYENLKDPLKLISSYNNIGLLYIDLKNYKQGLVFYNKALQLSHLSKKNRTVSLLLNNIGDVYLQKNEQNKALNYFYKALILNKKLKDNQGISLNLTNIGICYINLKNYEKGIETINQSILNYDDSNNLYNTYNIFELGRVHYLMTQEQSYKNHKKENIDKSISYLKNSLANFKKYKSLKDIQDTYYFLSKANKAKENYEVALDYFEKYSKIKDSIFSKDSEKKLANLEFQREIDLKDKQIEIQNLRIKSDSRKVYLLITVTSAVAILLALFLWLYISKRRNNQLLKEKNALISNINSQKDKFYSIIAHDLRGPFNGFLGLTELMAEDLDMMSTDDIKFAAVNMRSSAKNLFNLLENLLEWSRMEQNLIPFIPKEHPLKSIISESILTLHDGAYKKGITINTDIDSSKIVFADKNMFQAILRNIVLNAIKFTSKNGVIDIYAKENLTDILITVKDTGIGMCPKIVEDLFKLDVQNNRLGTEEEPSTGLGLILCKEFIEIHKGRICVESVEGKGSAFHISFPNKNPNHI